MSTLGGAVLFLPARFGQSHRAIAEIPGGTLSPLDVPKFVDPVFVPPAMPGRFKKQKVQYRIAARQFSQQVLPDSFPATTVWGYGSIDYPGTAAEGGTFSYPGFTIEAQANVPVQIQWRNELLDAARNYLPHLLPVDPTLMWANPPGGLAGRDMRPTFEVTPGPYLGPVPLVCHVHGAHTREDSDGHASGWTLPDARNIPVDYAHTGTYFDYFNEKYRHDWDPGSMSFKYPNDQRATTLWYHDHALGLTRLNVYAGAAGFYLIRGGAGDQVDGVLPGPAPGIGDNPFGTYYEVPMVIQDRSFNEDGSLFYPDTRAFFDEYGGPYIPESSVPPIWNPEFFANMMVVNGTTWPYLEVERRRYRFRLLNGCNSRFLVLKLTTVPRQDNANFNSPQVPFWQIGADGGFLPAPVQLDHLLMAPAERADVIVDFAELPVGTELYLVNDGPDAPFGGISIEDLSDWESTGQVMKFVVGPATSSDPSTAPQDLLLPVTEPLGPADRTRRLSLSEEAEAVPEPPFEGPIAALLGTVDDETHPVPLQWNDPVSENPALGATETWDLYNFTEDAHPIHIHLVQFEVISRMGFGGDIRLPESWESGRKDTVIAYPGEVTRIKATFDTPGRYVWHCHILEHEDNEMMRPFHVGPIEEIDSPNEATAAQMSVTTYPEPFNPAATIRFNVPQDGRVKVEVFDVRGRRVSTLVNGLRSAGTQEVRFDASGLPSGLYFARVTAAGKVSTARMLLLK